MTNRSCPADTAFQNFLVEVYDKERDTRIRWHRKAQNEPKIHSTQFEVFKKKIGDSCPKPTEALLQLKDVQPQSYRKRVVRMNGNLTGLASLNTSKKIEVDMVPAESKLRDKLYCGISKEGKGRYQYLHARYGRMPENKYQFPVVSSWEYGWRLGDMIKPEDIKKPVHGRTRIVADTFYARNGIPAMHLSATF